MYSTYPFTCLLALTNVKMCLKKTALCGPLICEAVCIGVFLDCLNSQNKSEYVMSEYVAHSISQLTLFAKPFHQELISLTSFCCCFLFSRQEGREEGSRIQLSANERLITALHICLHPLLIIYLSS